jgi:hypothetical protein
MNGPKLYGKAYHFEFILDLQESSSSVSRSNESLDEANVHLDPDRDYSLDNLANVLSTRFEQLGKIEDLRRQSCTIVKFLFFVLLAIPATLLLSIASGMPC